MNAPATVVERLPAPTWRAAVAPWAAAEPATWALICAAAAMDTPDAWRALVRRDGTLALALAHSPPWALLALPLATDAASDRAAIAAAVAADLAAAPVRIDGVNAPEPWATAITAACGRQVARRVVSRLHRLAGPPRLPRAAPGAMRRAQAHELVLIEDWRDAFDRDAEIGVPRPPLAADEVSSFRLWIDDGQPRSMARATRPQLGGWSIGAVYTPPDERRRGYAGALVHALSAHLLAEGAAYVALFTDLANPTSNRLYAAIGFAPVIDQVHLTWSPPCLPIMPPRCGR